MKNLSENILTNLSEGVKYPKVSPDFETYGSYSSVTNDDALDALDELINYFEDFIDAIDKDGMYYQAVREENIANAVQHLKQAKELIVNSCEV